MKSICIDFDGTVTEDSPFPTIGEEIMWVDGFVDDFSKLCDDNVEEMIRKDGIHEVDGAFVRSPATHVIKKLSDTWRIIIFTCRTGKHQQAMIDWFSNDARCRLYPKHDFYINFNPECPEAHEKPFADVYLDNRGLTFTKNLFVTKEVEFLASMLPPHIYVPTK